MDTFLDLIKKKNMKVIMIHNTNAQMVEDVLFDNIGEFRNIDFEVRQQGINTYIDLYGASDDDVYDMIDFLYEEGFDLGLQSPNAPLRY